MTRPELEHIIRAAGAIADDPDIVVIGSQAVLGQFPDAPAEFLRSMEADLYPRSRPERSDLVEGGIGEGSPFAREFGYYAHGIGPETAILPEGWEQRLVRVENENTRHVRGWCLEVHDLAVAKLAAGREKDLEFVAGLMRLNMVDRNILLTRLEQTPLPDERREINRARIGRDCK